jgi:hypothetical protein
VAAIFQYIMYFPLLVTWKQLFVFIFLFSLKITKFWKILRNSPGIDIHSIFPLARYFWKVFYKIPKYLLSRLTSIFKLNLIPSDVGV